MPFRLDFQKTKDFEVLMNKLFLGLAITNLTDSNSTWPDFNQGYNFIIRGSKTF